MELGIKFNQGDLISATGDQFPIGICLGLVAQWLVSISKTISQEGQFWQDLNDSVKGSPNAGLLGVGYARKAIEFQSEYSANLPNYPSTGDYTKTVLKNEGGLILNTNQSINRVPDNSAFTPTGLTKIADKVQKDVGRYFILCLRGTAGGHAVGVHRTFLTNAVQIFDPNIGRYSCNSNVQDIQDALAAIGNFYHGGLHSSWGWDSYE